MEEKKVDAALEEKQKREEYHYDAFISYRHAETDKFVAENLHRRLESFRMPQSVVKKRSGLKNSIERVFRDKEELPLTSDLNDPIMTALKNSDWLIVICSPRFRESLWCKKEVETFVNIHGREKVLAVLMEGEPSESFPDELLYKIEKVTNPDGSVEEVKIPVEPLAADVRGKNKKEILKAMDTEVLRILAAMFHIHYDDLRQRHREQIHKRRMTIVSIIAVISLLFAVFCVGVSVRLHHKNQMIQSLADTVLEQQEDMKYEQALTLAELSLQALEEGDREGAISIALEALTQKDSLSMPYTPEAQYALTESLRAYDSGNVFRAQHRLETMGIVQSMKMSSDGFSLAVLDETGTFTVYDTETAEVMLELGKGAHGNDEENSYTFLSENRVAYLNKDDEISIYNIREDKTENIDFTAERLYSDDAGIYLAAEGKDGIYRIYDGETLKEIGKTPDFEGVFKTDYFSIDSNGMIVCAYRVQGTASDTIMYCMELSTMEVLFNRTFEGRDVEAAIVDESRVYVLAGYEGNYRGEANCYVCAMVLQTGQVLWEDEQNGCYANLLSLSAEADDSVFVASDCNISIYHIDNGSVIYRGTVESKPICVEATGTYAVLLEDGSYLLAGSNQSEYLDITKEFQCRTDHNVRYCMNMNSIAVLEDNDNKITIYTRQTADKVMLTQDSVKKEEPVYYTGEGAIEFAKEYGLENPACVNTLFFDKDRNTVFASYWNGDFVIYDTYGEYVVNCLEECETMTGYFGKDANGYTYIKSDGGGYVLTEDMRPVMYIPYMVALNSEEKKVYIENEMGMYEAPIYTIMDILQMAAPYMEAKSES